MKTPDAIKTEIEKIQAEIQNTVNERNFCIQKAEQLLARINYLSGKFDTLKEMSELNNTPITPKQGRQS